MGEAYRKYRVGYSNEVIELILIHTKMSERKNPAFVDVGAGTGIWTRQVAEALPSFKCTAVEPNDSMRENGKIWTKGLNVDWKSGTGEETGLPDGCADLVSMASSFHWTDSKRSLPEFHRILKKGGYLTLVWNPLVREGDVLQEKVETLRKEIIPEFTRGSRARDDFGAMMESTGHFKDVIEIRMINKVRRTPDEYIEAWKAVNHLQAVAGPERFAKFLDGIRHLLRGKESIDVPYLTKSWTGKRVD